MKGRTMRITALLAPVMAVVAAGLLLLPQQVSSQSDPNRFNRLMRLKPPCNQPPEKDGIHAPNNPGTQLLQSPTEAFSRLPDAKGGNCVDWVEALNNGKIDPRAAVDDPNAQMLEFDLNIVREVKGSMPDVVYPHKEHTQWLECSNCHPKIFIPKKGANQFSMASILLGEDCGVCHGKVAFPVSDCLRCHSGASDAQDAPVVSADAPAVKTSGSDN